MVVAVAVAALVQTCVDLAMQRDHASAVAAAPVADLVEDAVPAVDLRVKQGCTCSRGDGRKPLRVQNPMSFF